MKISKLEIETPQRLLQVTHVKMYHTKAVALWRGMVASAHEKLGGVHSGIGFIGSLGWVVAASAVLGAIEGAVSSANAKEGVRLLGKAGSLMAEIQARGVYIAVSEIENIETPKPANWRAVQGTIAFTTLDEEFIPVRTEEQGDLSVRWSALASIRCFSPSIGVSGPA